MNLSEKIIQLKKLKGWSQDELSKKIKVSREIIGRYERSDATPLIIITKRKAKAFEVSLDCLVSIAEEKVEFATLDSVLKINKLPEEDKKVEFA